LQHCGLRYPGRSLKLVKLIPQVLLFFIGDQIEINPDALVSYTVRAPTR